MIHYITVAVALERPPTVQQYRRYAIYGGTHQDAELAALQMAACTSTMPVSVERDPAQARVYDCLTNRCTAAAPVEPHGCLGCRCWPLDDDAWDYIEGDDCERWQIHEHCPHHGSPGGAPIDGEDTVALAGACPCPCTACYEYCEAPRLRDAPEAAASASGTGRDATQLNTETACSSASPPSLMEKMLRAAFRLLPRA